MFTVEEILKATGGKLTSGSAHDVVSGISTDSRTVSNGELFIALEGDKFNGHTFVQDALAKGAKAVVVRKGWRAGALVYQFPERQSFIEVNDTLKALGDIAHFHRMRFDIPVIGITGSNGKTTTKDMIAHILGTKFRVMKNHGTFNNQVGVPLSILKLTDKHQACVLEMGANHSGEIKKLVDIAEPNIGVITNIGPSHLEFFKDLETVSQAKMEIFHRFRDSGLAIWDADDSMLTALYQVLNCRKKTFGLSAGCDYQAVDVEGTKDGWRFTLSGTGPVCIKLLGRHNVQNALAAIAVSDALGVGFKDIVFSLFGFSAPSMRMEILAASGITIINDSYNSNPKSMESAINVLSNFEANGRKILISGDMLELGSVSRYFHNQIGLNVANSGIDIFVGVGEMSKEAVNAALAAGMNKNAVYLCKDSKEAGALLLKIAHTGDAVLIKGSRRMAMEKICSTIYSTR